MFSSWIIPENETINSSICAVLNIGNHIGEIKDAAAYVLIFTQKYHSHHKSLARIAQSTHPHLIVRCHKSFASA